MGDRTGISWTAATWNPTTGCERVSPGCDRCYAETLAPRLAHTDAYRGVVGPGGWTGQVNMLAERLEIPLRWSKPRLIFVDSMSDLLHRDVTDEFIAQVFAVMALANRHTFQLLTKRAQRLELLGRPAFREMVAEAVTTLMARGGKWAGSSGFTGWASTRTDDGRRWYPPWPLPNVWVGVSVESPRYLWRLRHLRRANAAVRFASVEPLLDALVLGEHLYGPGRLDWVIVGGESGRGARPMAEAWVTAIAEECVAAEVPLFVKQMGAVWAAEHGLSGKAHELDVLPEALQVRDWPRATTTVEVS